MTKLVLSPFVLVGKMPYLPYKYYLYHIPSRVAFVDNQKVVRTIIKNPDLLPENLRTKLHTAGFLYSSDTQPSHCFKKPKTLTIWLHLLNSCNLKCPYCFVNKSKPEILHPQNATRYIERIIKDMKQLGFNKLKIKFSGGEPLLPKAFENLQKIHNGLQKLARAYKITIHEIIITNGTLLNDSILNFISSNNIQIAISLDGYGPTHNITRSTSTGQPTFNIIKNNIESLSNKNILFNISVVVTKYNLNNLKELIQWAFDRPKSIPVKLNFVRDNPFAEKSATPRIPDLIKSLTKIYQLATQIIIKRKHNPFLLNGLLDYISFTTIKDFTCEAGRSYLTLKANGTINTCHMLLHSPGLSLQTITDNILLELAARQTPLRLTVDDKKGCSTCPIRYVCGGGCPLLTKYIYGTYNRPSYYCPAYKTLTPLLLGNIIYAQYRLSLT